MNDDNKEVKDKEIQKLSFKKEIDSFIKHIESQADIVPLVMNLISAKLEQESKHVDKFLKDNKFEEKKNGEESHNEEDKTKEVKLIIPTDR